MVLLRKIGDVQAVLKILVAKGSDAKAKLRELNIPEGYG